ncbi:peroxide stress protein YaaA [Agrococcus sp. HG114]|uniref:peroxide stress protein YaaA n=1 Tax=Agrococcus sp. HG114 TaxID=2969757 RepID=UPI00215B3838|nr:peroxide stress protein YaaA [Agrococcus sp. HG114]MCR8670722.1 peroxide stress protein YaaA [Agrococcus sp. HG114]
MIVLLPPSETKAAGGSGAPLETASLGFPGLAVARSRALAALDRLVAHGQDASTPAKARAAADNAAVRTSPTMPAIERYTGVLYDALAAAELPAAARRWVDDHVVIQSALLGFVRASDRIPAYKVSEHSKLPGERMRELWSGAGEQIEGFALDLRSKAYAALAPVPGAEPVEIVSREGKPLNHWNKAGKGALVRALALAGVQADTADALLAWAASADVPLTRGDAGLRLVVEDPRLVAAR